MRHRTLGIAVIGSGRMGRLRAAMAASHPAVTFLAVTDRDPGRAEALARDVGAQDGGADNSRVINDDRVEAVIVSTSEPEHAAPAIEALKLGKPVLVEKPIALTLSDADRMIAASEDSGASLHVAYSLRFNRSYMVGKQQVLDGKLGHVVTATGRLYNTKAHGLEIIKRSTEATFVKDALTYLVDLVGWYLGGAAPVEIVARAHGLAYRQMGHDADEASWAILTYPDGAIVNLGVGYALPSTYPTHGRLIRLELLGDKGVLLFDHDHRENILHSEEGVTHAYVGHKMEAALLTSNASGNRALGAYWGPLGEETRSWLDHLSTGQPSPHATAREARATLEVTEAIERAARLREPVLLP